MSRIFRPGVLRVRPDEPIVRVLFEPLTVVLNWPALLKK